MMKVRMIIINDIEIYEVSNIEFSNLINKWMKNRDIPKKMYFTKKNNDLYIGLDNEHGSCYVEEFDTRDRVICWLVRNDYSASEINRLIDIRVRKLIDRKHYKIIKEEIEVLNGI